MNPLLEYIKAQKPELAEVITVIDSIQSQQQNQEEKQKTIDVELLDDDTLVENSAEKKLSLNQIKALKEKVIKLQRLITILKQEIINESEINNDFALAIGACKDCFGCDEYCETCYGKGKPGFFVPDLVHYNDLIVPAQKKYNTHFNSNKNY